MKLALFAVFLLFSGCVRAHHDFFLNHTNWNSTWSTDASSKQGWKLTSGSGVVSICQDIDQALSQILIWQGQFDTFTLTRCSPIVVYTDVKVYP